MSREKLREDCRRRSSTLKGRVEMELNGNGFTDDKEVKKEKSSHSEMQAEQSSLNVHTLSHILTHAHSHTHLCIQYV